MRPLVATVSVVAVGVFAGCGFGGEEPAGPVAALTPPESSWLPGQKPLGAYPEFVELFGRAVGLATERLKARELELERIERAKIAAREQADREARRKYLEAKRRAEEAYKRALKRAAAERRRQEAELRRLEAKRARELAKREEKLKVEPGEECDLPSVRERFDCRTGRLPDPATDGKKKRR